VLSSNPFLTGSLPRALSRLTKLQQLVLSYTAISGRLPRFLAALTRLTVLGYPIGGVGCLMEGRCEIKQDRSSMFCKICSTFCSTCIPIN
ncbi:unnamed protein product, partial [Closterium sp. Yama58-4]